MDNTNVDIVSSIASVTIHRDGKVIGVVLFDSGTISFKVAEAR